MDWTHQTLINEKERLSLPKEYYTPDAEDMHIGYIYQYRHGNKWIDTIFADGRSVECWEEQRSKYLDEKDIKSLGWEYSHILEGGSEDRFSINFRKPFSNGYYQLEINQNRFVTISLWNCINIKNPVSQTHWRGHLNSINELKIIEKLLNI